MTRATRLGATVRPCFLLLVVSAAVATGGCASARGVARRADSAAAERAAAEARALETCQGVPPAELAPGVAGLDVVRVCLLERPLRFGTTIEGAAAAVRASSFPSLERVIRCRAARAALDRDDADPFAVPGVVVRTYRDDDGVGIVQMRSRKPAAVRELVRRLGAQFPVCGRDDLESGEDGPSWTLRAPGTRNAAPAGGSLGSGVRGRFPGGLGLGL